MNGEIVAVCCAFNLEESSRVRYRQSNPGYDTRPRHQFPTLAILLVILLVRGHVAFAQAPGLAWSTNLGARVFAIDSQTNIYAHSGGTVFTLDSSGHVLQTNQVCPIPGLARRDSAGNFYFGGSFDGTQNFGGITLVGGWTNNNGHYSSGWPTCFLAKYASNGALLWVTNFGYQAQRNGLSGLALDPAGGFYTGYAASSSGANVAHLSNSGAVEWIWVQSIQFSIVSSVSLGGATTSNCCALTIRLGSSQFADMNRIDRTGSSTGLGQFPLQWRSFESTNGVPVLDDSANAFQAGGYFNPQGPCTNQWLRKCAPGTDLYDQPITMDAEWVLARDPQGNVYLGGTNGMVAQYNNSGVLNWSNNFGRLCVAMVVDASGNRFISLSDGSVARLQEDGTPQSPHIISGPLAQTAFVGDNVTLSVNASGTPPLAYAWQRGGTNLPGATAADLHLNPAVAADSGQYTVIVSNYLNSITSNPAMLRVKSVQLYLGNQMLTNGNYVFGSPPTLTIRSAFTNGSRYYTLDGTTPSQASRSSPSGQFILEHNAVV